MVWAVKYSKQFQQGKVTPVTYRVDILSEAGGAVVVPDRMSSDPLSVRTLAGSKTEYKPVVGSEIAFEFILLKGAGAASYDPLFESEYREHIVKLYNDDTSELIWQGYLQPENAHKSIFESNMHIYLSATDALKDLNDFDFLDSGNIIQTRLSGLAIIKLALSNLDTGSQFQYNFIVKLGTKHDGQGANATALADATYDCRRFYTTKAGKTTPDTCLTVIEKVLEPFDCVLRQYGGKYYIQHIYEGDTFNYTYNWALAFQSKAAATDIVNIDSYKFKRGGEISQLSPVKEMRLKLLNRSMGDELVANINSFADPGGGWDITDLTLGDFAVEDAGATMHMHLLETNEANRTIVLNATFGLTKQTEGDYIKLKFQVKFGGTTPPFEQPYLPSMIITVIKPSGEISTWNEPIPPYWYQWESQMNNIFWVDTTGNYNIKIEFVESDMAGAVYDEEVYIKNFSLTKIISADGTTYTDVTFDKYYRALSSKGKIIFPEQDIFFGDSVGSNDLAALKIGGANTNTWNRAGVVDELPLLNIHCLNFLSGRQDYTEYIIIDVKDTRDSITPINSIQFLGKYYNIVSFDKSLRHSWTTLHLRQRLTTDVAVIFIETPLTSVDGIDPVDTSYQPVTSDLTASIILSRVKTVDGTGSGLDADLLDGSHASAFAASAHTHDDRYYTEGEMDTFLGSKADLAGGLIPAAQLPSYVDDVIDSYIVGTTYESDWLSETPGGADFVPVSGKLYIVLTSGVYQYKVYRWSGSTYVVISDSIVLGETSSTAYRGDRGKNAYDHSQNNNQAHSDYLKNNADDTTSGTLTAAGFKVGAFTITVIAGELVIQNGATVIAKITSAGYVKAKDEIEPFASV